VYIKRIQGCWGTVCRWGKPDDSRLRGTELKTANRGGCLTKGRTFWVISVKEKKKVQQSDGEAVDKKKEKTRAKGGRVN